ncbi:MAG: hypothetical protein M3Z30_08225 [Gemmatimonadota bacterium]|nr:hypothetical protein [Gemmatimonadota bacterium]
MNQVSHLVAPRETVFGLLASSARRLSFGALALVSLGAGAVPAVASVTSHASWQLLAVCYLVWCFAAWGTLFHDRAPRSTLGRSVQAIIVVSGTVVFGAIFMTFFFGALGPRWML